MNASDVFVVGVGMGFAFSSGVAGPVRHLRAVIALVIVAFNVLAVLVLVWDFILGVFHEMGKVIQRRRPNIDGGLRLKS